MTDIDMRKWYVAHTHPHAERKAASHLARQGFEPYLPLYLKRRRHARRVEFVAAALFPRYLFVAVDTLTQRWRAIQSTIGIARLVCNHEVPVAVAEGIVEALRQREDSSGFIKLDPAPRFRAGDRIRVLDGPFIDRLGLYEGVSDRNRVAVLLDLLGRKVRILLSEENLEAA